MEALLCCLYLETNLSILDVSLPRIETVTSVNATKHGVIETTKFSRISDRSANPYGRVTLGWETPVDVPKFGKVHLSLEASHMSSLSTGIDKGINSISVGARVYLRRDK